MSFHCCCLQGCGHSGSSNFEKMTRLHPNNNRIPLFMLATPTAFSSLQDSPRRRNCLTSLLLNNLIKQKKKCQFLPTSQKQSCGGKKGTRHQPAFLNGLTKGDPCFAALPGIARVISTYCFTHRPGRNGSWGDPCPTGAEVPGEAPGAWHGRGHMYVPLPIGVSQGDQPVF